MCMKGTGGLGEEMCSCFDGSRRPKGAEMLIDGVTSVHCVIIGSRRSTLLLRGGLVGGCGPQCGILLGSSGACPSVYMRGRCFPQVFGAHGVVQGNSSCCNPCDRIPSVGTILSLVGRLCPLQAYGLGLSPRGVHTNGFGIYLRCRVGGYTKPYVKLRSRRRCLGGVSRVGRVLGKGARRVDHVLFRRVRKLTTRVGFRRTRGVGRGCALVRGCHSGSRMMDSVLRGVSMFSVRRSRRGSTFVGCLRVAGKTVGRTFAFRCGGGLGRDGRRLLALKVVRVQRHCGDLSHRVVIPFRMSVRLGGIIFAIPRQKSGGGLLSLSLLGMGRCGTSQVGRSRGLGPRREDVQLVGRVRRRLRLRGLPVRVRYFSGSGVRNSSTMTTYIMFGGTGPSGRSCQGCVVGAMRNPSSCTSVERIMGQHCRHTVRRRDALPSLVVASKKGKRVRTMERIVRRLRLGVPVTNLTGSQGRHASRLLFNFPPRAVKLGRRSPLFGLLRRVRSRMRHFTVAFRHSGHDGHRMTSTLSAVGNVKSGAGATLLGRFGDMGHVGRTSLRSVDTVVNRAGTGIIGRGLWWRERWVRSRTVHLVVGGCGTRIVLQGGSIGRSFSVTVFMGLPFRWGGGERVEMIVRHIDRTSIAVGKGYGSTVGEKVLVLMNVRRTSKARSVS